MKLTDNIPDWLPFQTQQAPRMDVASAVLPALGVFGAGLLVGAGIGILLAPKPGRELRGEIAATAQNAIDRLPSTFQNSTSEQAITAK